MRLTEYCLILADICIDGFAHNKALVNSVASTVQYMEISALPLTRERADGIGRGVTRSSHPELLYIVFTLHLTEYTQSIHRVYSMQYSVRVECSSIWSSDKP